MDLQTTTILGIKITLNDKKDIINYVLDYLQKKSGQPLVIFTPNPEQIIQARENPEFSRVLNRGDINLPDGQRLVWADKLVGSAQLAVDRQKPQTANRKPQTLLRIAGIEFMEELVKAAAKKDYPIALIGGREESAAGALNKLKQKYPGLKGWAEKSPEFRIRNQESGIMDKKISPDSMFIIQDSSLQIKDYFNQLAKRIIRSNTKLVFVGLGAPKQEIFIKAISQQLSAVRQSEDGKPSTRTQAEGLKVESSPIILMSVGGAFDILSGKLPRVPKVLSNLEFIWRLILEPGRFIRQLRLLKFIYLVYKQRFVLK